MPLLNVTHYKQRHEADCLATCSRMLLEYIGNRTRYRRLLRLLQVDADDAGTSFYQLKKLETLGVTVEIDFGYMGILADHCQNRRPVIASVDTRYLPSWHGLWRLHAVVVVGLDTDTVFLNDPAFDNAPFSINRTDFESAWLEREYLYATIQ